MPMPDQAVNLRGYPGVAVGATELDIPGKLVNKTPCLYLCSFPFVVAALLLVGRLASLAWILTYSTVVIQIQTRSLIHQFSL